MASFPTNYAKKKNLATSLLLREIVLVDFNNGNNGNNVLKGLLSKTPVKFTQNFIIATSS